MARGPVFRNDAVMMTCPSCGTENPEGNRFCIGCGTALDVPAAVASAPAPRPAREAVTMIEEPSVAIPDWVFPARIGTSPAAEPKPARGRTVKFVLLLLVWLGVFGAAPGWGIWSTSPFLREVGPSDYFRSIPTCEQSARAAGEDPSVCSQPDVQAKYRTAAEQVRAERHRVLAFSAIGFGALAMATLVLVLAAGLRPWWAFSVVFSPLNLVVWVWALWRIAAYPVRYWERRSRT